MNNNRKIKEVNFSASGYATYTPPPPPPPLVAYTTVSGDDYTTISGSAYTQPVA